MNNEDQTITKSSGNVFADLGLENSDELLAKSTLAHIDPGEFTEFKLYFLIGPEKQFALKHR